MDSLRQKLIGLINATKRKKPYRCEVEYVESTEKDSFFPLFTTDNIVDSTTSWEVRLSFNDVSFTGQLMGYGYSGNNRYNLGIESGKFRFAYSTTWFDAAITTPDTNPHTWKLEPVNGKDANAYIDWQVTSTTASNDFGANNWFIGIGGRSAANNQIQSGTQFGWKLYYSKVWKAGKLVVDVIPVIDWDDKPCLYDKISGKLIYATIRNTLDSSGTLAIITAGREIHRVDWISSPNRNVCFNTNIYPQMDNFKIEVRAIKEANTSLFGSNTTNNYYDLTGSSGNNYAHYGTSAGSFASFALTDQNMPHTFMMENGNVYCDGVLKGSKTSESFTSSVPMGLFARITNASGTFNDSGNHTMYYTKIWNNGSLVRDYYPAIDETGKAFLFDKVSHQIFDNTGTGVVNYPPVEVEYLQSSGTQYIDTPATFKDTDTVEFKGALLTLTSDKFCMSPTTWNAGNNRFSMLGYYSPSLGVAFGSQGTPSTIFVPNLVNTDVHTVRFEDRKFTMLDTGSVYDPTSAVTFANETDGIKMFYGYNAPTSCKFYYYKHWRDGVIKYNFVAALCNGEAGLYDKVNNVFYPNNGTGDFTYGKIKN